MLAPWLTVMAADEEGFVVPPDGAMRAAGPVGRERDIAEILATRERTKGTFGIFRIEIAPKSGPPAHIHRGEDEFFYRVNLDLWYPVPPTKGGHCYGNVTVR